jgi:hypothetical protein
MVEPRKSHHKLVIGIDVGEVTGLAAVLHVDAGDRRRRLVMASAVRWQDWATLKRIAEWIRSAPTVTGAGIELQRTVVIELPMGTTYYRPGTGYKTMLTIAQKVGRNMERAEMLASYLRSEWMLDVRTAAPLRKGTKRSPGWVEGMLGGGRDPRLRGAGGEHVRDAAVMAATYHVEILKG